MPQFETVATGTQRPQRDTLETIALPSTPTATPGGAILTVTRLPHRDGRPGHYFIELWVRWLGGSLRSSACFLVDDQRRLVKGLVSTLTDLNHDDAIDQLLDRHAPTQ